MTVEQKISDISPSKAMEANFGFEDRMLNPCALIITADPFVLKISLKYIQTDLGPSFRGIN
jgi:hypothetical protein